MEKNYDINIELIKRYKMGDKSAGDELCRENMRLVYSVAKRFANRGVEFEDIVQIGCLGFFKAIEKFDLSFGVKLSTYAVPLVIGEIKRFLRDDGIIKISRSVKEVGLKGLRAAEHLRTSLMREPTIGEIAIEAGVSSEEITEAFEAMCPPEDIFYSDENRISERLSCDCEESGILDRVMLDAAMSELSQRQRKIIELRYFGGKTQCETAKIIGISQVQVSRIERGVIEQLRMKLSSEV